MGTSVNFGQHIQTKFVFTLKAIFPSVAQTKKMFNMTFRLIYYIYYRVAITLL